MNERIICDIARGFLAALEVDKNRGAEPSRPIIFIAHGLGGIIVKEMLRQSLGYRPHHPRLYGIFKATLGIIFFGTPHGDAGIPDLGGFLVKPSGLCADEQAVDSLHPPSGRVGELRDEFNQWLSNKAG